MEIRNKPIKESNLSCTFCGPGTWAVWEVLTDEGVFFACDMHRLEMKEANLIKSKRKIRKDYE